jgi:hypothetical protein
MLALSDKWGESFASIPETGMGYTVLSVILKDGRRFDRVCVNGGIVTKIGDSTSIPFAESDIDQFVDPVRK